MNRNPIQPIIVSKFPSYLKSEYPNFFKLLSDFYSWLDDNYISHLGNFAANCEANSEVEPFISAIMSEIGWNYTLATPSDKRLVTNTLLDFYLSRGNEYSFEYVFRAIFNQPVTIDYPRKRLFTLSSAEYRNDTLVLLSANSIGSSAFQYITESGDGLGITLFGYVSGVEENVNYITPIVHNKQQFLLVSIDGTKWFRPYETVHLDLNGVRILEQIYNTITLDSIVNPGVGYRRGDTIKLTGAGINGFARVKSIMSGSVVGVDIIQSGSNYELGDPVIVSPESVTRGFGFFAKVSLVSVTGSILEVEISNGGYEYEEMPTFTIKSKNGQGAVLSPVPYQIGGISEIEFSEPYWKAGDENSIDGEITSEVISSGTGASLTFRADTCVFESPKEFYTDQGVIGINAVLHDSLYFQEYSYEVNSPVSPRLYQTIIENSVHPAGLVRYIVFNHDSPLKYNFNSLDTVKFNLADEIGDFSHLSFETEVDYKNYSAVYEPRWMVMRSYSSEESSLNLQTGFAFIRYPDGSITEMYLSSQERIPSTFIWDTSFAIDDLRDGFTYIHHYEAGHDYIMLDIRTPKQQINSDGINEVTLG